MKKTALLFLLASLLAGCSTPVATITYTSNPTGAYIVRHNYHGCIIIPGYTPTKETVRYGLLEKECSSIYAFKPGYIPTVQLLDSTKDKTIHFNLIKSQEKTIDRKWLEDITKGMTSEDLVKLFGTPETSQSMFGTETLIYKNLSHDPYTKKTDSSAIFTMQKSRLDLQMRVVFVTFPADYSFMIPDAMKRAGSPEVSIDTKPTDH
jgi:outer membrane protein assembly factor BamE (lipoprotein component of BamABCDE complex)